jgi:FAD dependent oxidoreductase TIGR03364
VNSVTIVGAGILGLAHAYTYARRGWRVTVCERSPQAAGASIRNFGMLWPIGQPAGEMAELAGRSLAIWREVLRDAQLPHLSEGSLHLAYHADEEDVCREFAAREPERGTWIDAAAVMRLSAAAHPVGLRGALHSPWELTVDPRQIIAQLPAFLAAKFDVTFRWNTAVTDAARLETDRVVICSGDEFATLYPEIFAASGLTRVKLQMLRTAPQPAGWRMGPALAAGLTLRFYSSFRDCPSLPRLRERIATTLADYDRWGIHVMASPTLDGAVTLGDSHEYGLHVDIFNKEEIDHLILRYLESFARFPAPAIAQRWYGVYSKHPEKPYFLADPDSRVRIVTGVGGAGMTLSFGLAEKLVAGE